jgi:hypothetical protein
MNEREPDAESIAIANFVGRSRGNDRLANDHELLPKGLKRTVITRGQTSAQGREQPNAEQTTAVSNGRKAAVRPTQHSDPGPIVAGPTAGS